MKKGLSKNVFMLVVLVALLGILMAYMMGYKKFVAEADKTKASNAALQTEVENLKQYYINEAMYKAEMEPMKEEIHTIMEAYPAETREEDIIMHAVYTQLSTAVKYSTISMGTNNTMQTISEDIVKATGQEDMQEAISFVERKGTYSTELTYEALKDAVKAVLESEYNIGIESLVYSKGEGRVLSGTMALEFYSMQGNGKEYELPNIAPYVNGTENIFGIITIPMAFDDNGNIIENEEEEIIGANGMLYEKTTIELE